jgi:hypothetical protein
VGDGKIALSRGQINYLLIRIRFWIRGVYRERFGGQEKNTKKIWGASWEADWAKEESIGTGNPKPGLSPSRVEKIGISALPAGSLP